MNGLVVADPDVMFAQVFQFYIRAITSFLVKYATVINLY